MFYHAGFEKPPIVVKTVFIVDSLDVLVPIVFHSQFSLDYEVSLDMILFPPSESILSASSLPRDL
jgi:hypothetical protein